jgi:SNF2 family DNA or RNA helicase
MVKNFNGLQTPDIVYITIYITILRLSMDSNHELVEGDKVYVKNDETKIGRISKIDRRSNITRYTVHISGEDNRYTAEDLVYLSEKPRYEKPREFLRDLLLLKLTNSLTDSLYSYKASRTLFAPYQFRPALKFLSNPDHRILIADEVGLGKTIEAAIIYLELRARLNVSRILVLCPSRLKEKWRQELLQRFDEDFVIYDKKGFSGLLQDIQHYGEKATFKGIITFESLRIDTSFTDVANVLMLDFLIVDEAHYMRNTATKTYKNGQLLVGQASAVVFLTATPLQLGSKDLFTLVNMLAPADYINLETFDAVIAPNQYVNKALNALQTNQVLETLTYLNQLNTDSFGSTITQNPYYQHICQDLEQLKMLEFNTPEFREKKVTLQRQIADLNTLSRVFTRTRKREVSEAAIRTPYTVNIELTQLERDLYSQIFNESRSIIGRGTGLARVSHERMAASSLPAFLKTIQNNERYEFSSYDLQAYDQDLDDEDAYPSSNLKPYKNIGHEDSKFKKFLEILQAILAENTTSKILVFSTYKGTLSYLQEKLKSYTIENSVIHGDIAIAERNRRIDEFRSSSTLRVFLSSEVGAEGLDFQFCDTLINYDLPWNPMQVEQRIGRLDRFGQKAERIRIYNLCITDTIEDRVFQRLYDRIELFKSAIGDLEEILGDEIKQLTQAIYSSRLTPEEEIAQTDVAIERIIRLRKEQEKFDEHRDELIGQDLFFQDEEVRRTIEKGGTISAQEVYSLIYTYLERNGWKTCLDNNEDGTWILECNVHLAEKLSQIRANIKDYPDFIKKIKANQRIPLTFDSELARERHLLEFVTIKHPLAQLAVNYWKQDITLKNGIPAFHVTIFGPENECDKGYFYIYAVDQKGVNQKRSLQAVIVLDNGKVAYETSKTLLKQIQTTDQKPETLDGTDEDFLKNQDYSDDIIDGIRDEIQDKARQRDSLTLEQRKKSVEATSKSKQQYYAKQRDNAENDRIRKMYIGAVENENQRCQEKLDELNKSAVTIVSTMLVAGGRIEILPIKIQSLKNPPQEVTTTNAESILTEVTSSIPTPSHKEKYQDSPDNVELPVSKDVGQIVSKAVSQLGNSIEDLGKTIRSGVLNIIRQIRPIKSKNDESPPTSEE